MTNPLLKRYSEKKHGTKSEKRIAKSVGARSQPASGSLLGRKGDSELPDFLIESKSTIRNTMRLEHGWLRKIEDEALQRNKTPVLTISFVLFSGLARPSGDWVCVPKWFFDAWLSK